MAFHLHLIDKRCDCLNASPLEFIRGAPAGSSQAGRLVLHWAIGTRGQPTARWILARD